MRVIVTRPEREAQAWAETLARHGIDAVVLPLIDIRAVSDTAAVRMAWQRLDDYAALMFVSGAAVDHFFALRPPGASAPFAGTRQGPRLWCAGPGTAAALLRHGIARTSIDSPAPDSGQFDSEALWQVVRDAVRARDKVLVVRGGEAAPDLSVGGPALQQAPPEGATILEAARPLLERASDESGIAGTGRDWLARQLQAAGAEAEFLMAYQRSVPAWSSVQSALARSAADDGSLWVFTSAQALAHLDIRAPRQDWGRARALATHARIADAARAVGFGVVWESRPALSDVVASIESIR